MAVKQQAKLKVVLCWHMHQPEYRDLASGEYQLPWTYLHAIKDYVDMAAHLEANPAARAVVNFAPVLLDQIADYARQVDDFLKHHGAIRDPVLAALGQAALPVDAESRLRLIKACMRANEQRVIARFAPYKHLVDLGGWLVSHPGSSPYLSDQFLADILVWHHLAWLGETVRRTDVRAQRLQEKGGGYTLHDRRELLILLGELLRGVIPRYAALAKSGRIELSMTPYAHPMVPLLLDFAQARQSMPDVILPELKSYPHGEERAHWHIRAGAEAFQHHFGFKPKGCWPSEGGVSDATLALLGEAGFKWIASGEGVLRHSLAGAGQMHQGTKDAWLYQPYTGANGLSCFFRDDGLSDLIGFTYATWHADDAASDLVHHLERIADHTRAHSESVVAIILDGENAWDHYPENGYYFLNALYRRLSEHPRIALTTFSECLAAHPTKTLGSLVAGSWVYGTFSTWIGDPDKNRAWDMLGDAANAFHDAAPHLDRDQRVAAERALAICEGSDWFWWFGGYNPAATVSDFERLYRLHLTSLYQLLDVEPPDYLANVFTRGAGTPLLGGTMRPSS